MVYNLLINKKYQQIGMKTHQETKQPTEKTLDARLSKIESQIRVKTSDLAAKPSCVKQLETLYKIIMEIDDKYTRSALINIISSTLHTDVTQLGDNMIKTLSDLIMSQYHSAPRPFHQFLNSLVGKLHDTDKLQDDFKATIANRINKEFNSIPVPNPSILMNRNNIQTRYCPPPAPCKRSLSRQENTKRQRIEHTPISELPQEIWHPERVSIHTISELVATLQNTDVNINCKLTYSDTLSHLVHRSEELARIVLEKGFFDGVECDQIVAYQASPRMWDVGALAIFLSKNIKEHKGNLEEYIKASCANCLLSSRDSICADVTNRIASTITYDKELKNQLDNLAQTFRSRIVISPFEARLNSC